MLGTITRRAAFGLSAAVLMTASIALAQEAKPFEPREGQEGKDVIWLPTHTELVNRMLNMARVTPDDYLIDLGSGDGRTVIAAALRDTNAMGIEYNPNMVEHSKRRAAQAGVSTRASFMKADIFESDFSKATVITMFLLPELNMRLRPKLLALKPGTRIVSNSFDMEDWQPDETTQASNGCVNHCDAFLWIVPANFAGTWKLPEGELKLSQKFQIVTGTLSAGNVATPLSDGKVRGNQLVFSAGGKNYSLTLGKDGLEGTSSLVSSVKGVRAAN